MFSLYSLFPRCFRLLFILLSLFISSFLTPRDVHSAQVTLAWDANTSAGIAGYEVYYGTSSGDYQSVINVGNTTTYTVSNLQSGLTYYFAVTDCDTSGDQSGYSNEVSYTVPAACTYRISPTSQSANSSSSSGAVSMTTSSGCSWTAVSNASWITITSNNSVIGSGTVNYSVAANPTTTSRSGMMTIAGQTFTVNQDGSSCSYTIGPTSGSFMASGGMGLIAVIGDLGCSWTAISNSSWVTITPGAGGSEYGVVNYSVAAYSGSYRTGTLTVAGHTFMVYQWGPGY